VQRDGDVVAEGQVVEDVDEEEEGGVDGEGGEGDCGAA